jgi:hypothetical protein
MTSTTFVAATLALAVLSMGGAAYAGPATSSASPGSGYYAAMQQVTNPNEAYLRTVPREHRVSAISAYATALTRAKSR